MHSKEEQLKKSKKPARKRCKECKKLFVPIREMQPCCGYECEINYISKPKNLKNAIKQGKEKRKKELAEKYPDKTSELKLTQKAVNEYIRLRDKNKPCISCGTTKNIQYHAGHFRPAGNNQNLRFYTLNIHKQCSVCNNYLSANLINYRNNLVEKLGLEKVQEIEANHQTKKYSVEYLQRMRKIFNKKIRLYKKKFRA